MKSIKSQDIKQAVNTLLENRDGTVYQEIGYTDDGLMLYLVLGYQEDYEKGEDFQVIEGDTTFTICAKLAFNVSSLQCDYDVDWYMPYDEKGNVYDTDSAITKDFQALADYYNKEAKSIIEMMNNGEISIN